MIDFEIAFGLNQPWASGAFHATIREFNIENGKRRYWALLHDFVLIGKFGKNHDYYFHEKTATKAKGYVDFTIGDDPEIGELHQAIINQIRKYRGG